MERADFAGPSSSHPSLPSVTESLLVRDLSFHMLGVNHLCPDEGYAEIMYVAVRQYWKLARFTGGQSFKRIVRVVGWCQFTLPVFPLRPAPNKGSQVRNSSFVNVTTAEATVPVGLVVVGLPGVGLAVVGLAVLGLTGLSL